MCGILGQFNRHCIDREIFDESLNLLSHRGPDNQNVKAVNQNLIFGHSRLSIIDLSEGSNQPMESEKSILVFNGEIYNYIQLRTELETIGIPFETSGDTEVLQKALDHWGVSALLKLNGMWALSYYNKENNSLTLSRDRFGKKPLYYYQDNNQFIFSSEIKSIFSINQKKRLLNRHFIEAFLYYDVWLSNSRNTFYSDIKQLYPGEIIEIDLSKNIELKFDAQNSITNFAFERTKLSELRYDIDDAVKIRMRSDVPIGIFISGGVDSTIVASCANQYSNEISWLSGNTGFGKDLDFSKEVARNLNVDLDVVNVGYDKKMLDRIKNMTRFFEIPIKLNGNSIGMNVLYENVSKKGIKVVLDGTGGDEMFGGYFNFHSKYLINSLLRKNSLKELLFFIFYSLKYKQYSGKLILRDVMYFYVNKLMSDKQKIKRKFLSRLSQNSNYYFEEELEDNPTLTDFLLKDIQYGRLQTWLKMNDMNSMMYSVESRSPLLDYRLLKYISNEASNKFNKGFNKFLLRCAIPSKISNNIKWRRDKQGFRWVASQFLADNMREIRQTTMKSKLLRKILSKDELEGYFRDKLTSHSEGMILRCYSIALLEQVYECDLNHK